MSWEVFEQKKKKKGERDVALKRNSPPLYRSFADGTRRSSRYGRIQQRGGDHKLGATTAFQRRGSAAMYATNLLLFAASRSGSLLSGSSFFYLPLPSLTRGDIIVLFFLLLYILFFSPLRRDS
ncbi:hypothetical protein HPB50_018662 [Hyalomma asiaticum]|uniref:Uncharacterized protein n=1 Tax=Hyalomma asiaticum TaxID=266040 RepID=A0ACB7SIL3_HYAAI|nr:hypothetical protein HPB50_018662 [Hyalomma asiaticum]